MYVVYGSAALLLEPHFVEPSFGLLQEALAAGRGSAQEVDTAELTPRLAPSACEQGEASMLPTAASMS